MEIRNGLYTLIGDALYAISEIRSEVPIKHMEKQFFIEKGSKSSTIISIADLKNVVEIRTYCYYKDALFQVFRFKDDGGGKVQIASRNENIANYLGMTKIRNDWFMKQISIKDLDEIWEERMPGLDFPLPRNLDVKKIIPLS